MTRYSICNEGTNLSYERRGDGPVVVLVQGLGLPGDLWLNLPGGLVKSGFTVVTPDNRGTGQSDAPTPPYTMRQLAGDLAAVIRDVDRGPAVVVGISFGGMVAQHLALRHASLVRGLVLAATTCGPPVGRPPSLRVFWTLVRSFNYAPETGRRLHELMLHPHTLRSGGPRIFEEWERAVTQRPTGWRGLWGQVSAATLHSTGFSLHDIHCPTVVITGEDDRVVPPVNSRILADRIPGAELVMVSRAGHAFPLENPAALPDAIRRVQQRVAG
jgi:pimeloyl-ACP methyl ester carboxylesterase